MNQKPAPLYLALIPIGLLVGLLFVNVKLFGEDSSYGSNQIALLMAAFLAASIGVFRGIKWSDILEGIVGNISKAMQAIIILLLIGSLSGTWLISGIVPAMIYYGLNILEPSYFLLAACIISSIISLASGSSWSTIATVGIALLAIGKVLGFSEGWIAGAIISGAYFGDKMSPLSDTTNLAPAMAGTDLITHIRYMALTTIPSITISMIVFFIYGFFFEPNPMQSNLQNVQQVQTAILDTFEINLALFLVPIFVIVLIIKKVKAIPALFLGTLAGAVFAFIFQPELLDNLGQGIDNSWERGYKVVIQSMADSIQIESDNAIVSKLLKSKGMSGMLNTVWLITCAMIFSGAMEKTQLLSAISSRIVQFAKTRTSLVGSTLFSCIFFNITASDQYLAIVVPGKMFSKAYKDKGLAPENLSRTLEDGGTVTSVLVPWNTCGVAQANILSVGTLVYAPYCIFNWLSPIMSMLFIVLNIKIKERIAKAQA
ncbi:MAG: Na+/H+ antiporter NhaC [Flavobacteriales bacterium]